ncbi:MAG: ribonuclease J [Thermodesulfobacteriota bacterium]
MLKIIPIGGLGEIGLNMMVFEYDNAMFVLDAGLMFPEDYMLGIDIVIPDMSYIRENRHRLSGVVLTHAHEDHIGALPYLLREINVPVFGTPFTIGILKHKLEEHGLLGAAKLHEISSSEILKIGPFELSFIDVSHSLVDGVGVAVKTPVGMIIHTGDFKINHHAVDGRRTDVNKFARFGDEGVLALLSDSTNVEKEGYTISDQTVGENLERIANRSEGRIIVALFASNVARIQEMVNIAGRRGSKVVFSGRSIELTVDIAKHLGYLNVPESMEITIDQVGQFPDREIVIITTGSQGEPMSALARMAMDTHKHIQIKPGDTVILSSKFIPGNEKAITNIINNLFRRGADVVYEKISDIHVSGHAFQEELKLMIGLTKPAYFIPIHGEYRHLLLHARLAKQSGIPEERILLVENGQTIEFTETGGRIGESIMTGRVLVDGKGIGDVGRSVLKERRSLAEDGLVIVALVFDEETGVVTYGPEIMSRGFVFFTETGHLLEDAQCVILEIVEDIGPEVADRAEVIRSKLQSALRQYFYFTIRRRPVIIPIILEL